MAKSIANSAYYPPRARGFRAAKAAWYCLRRLFHLEQLTKGIRVHTDSRAVLWLLVPGLFYLDRRRLVRGTSILVIWMLAMALYWVAIGLPVSSTAFLVLCGLHSLCVTESLHTAWGTMEPVQRLWRIAGSGFLIVFIGYSLFQILIVDRVVVPVRVRNHTVLINPGANAGSIQRGDWVAYNIPAMYGLGFEQVLGLPGDTVRFYADCFEVNGSFYQRTDKSLPTGGTFTVDKDCYLIWPTQLTGAIAENTMAKMRNDRALVARDAILGRAYKRWFARRQDYPSLVRISPPTQLPGKQP
jgi:hypothetical protein